MQRDQLAADYETKFGHPPAVAGYAPGRVNIIGEHIDYSGFAVFPMALSSDYGTTIYLGEVAGGIISVWNNDKSGFPDLRIPISSPDKALLSTTSHGKYIESPIRKFCQVTGRRLTGLDIMIIGSVPIAAGLSSSASLLCGLIMALDVLVGTNLPKQKIVTMAIDAEHEAGVNCGGMDQTASVFGQAGFGLYIDFVNPPRPTPLPKGTFVVAHCGQKAEKAASNYNVRVKEVAAAAQEIAGASTLREAVTKLGGFEQAMNGVKKIADEVVRKRAEHVLTEAQRVEAMLAATDIKEVGRLMTASHESCRDLYECSCEALDVLVRAGLAAGAVGGRLTGAGWGGCAIFLLSPDFQAAEFIAKLRETFYVPRGVADPIVFATEPGAGATAERI